MNRRSFIKRAGGLLGLAFVAPSALIPSKMEAPAARATLGKSSGKWYWEMTAVKAGKPAGDIIGAALDMDSGKIWWSKNRVHIPQG